MSEASRHFKWLQDKCRNARGTEQPTAAGLRLTGEIEHTRRIAVEGTGAGRQSAVYAEAIAQGADIREALKAIVDDLIVETRGGAPEVEVPRSRGRGAGRSSRHINGEPDTLERRSA